MTRTATTASLDVAHDGTVAVVTLRNEEAMNSFDAAYLRSVRLAMEATLANDDVRAIVVTGSGRAFSAGADVGAMAEAAARGEGAQWVLDATAQLHPLLLAVHASEKPFIAAVNGVAAGGGLGLALACDARIGCQASRFAAGYFGIGLSPDGGATWLMPRLIGLQRTRRFFFENEVMGAQDALEAGLLDEVVEDQELLDRCVQVARKWGAWGVHSRQSTKRLLASSLDTSFAAQMDAERGLIAAAAATQDHREGTRAFREKRQPSFA